MTSTPFSLHTSLNVRTHHRAKPLMHAVEQRLQIRAIGFSFRQQTPSSLRPHPGIYLQKRVKGQILHVGGLSVRAVVVAGGARGRSYEGEGEPAAQRSIRTAAARGYALVRSIGAQ